MKKTLLSALLASIALAANAQRLIINEVMAANLGEALDPSYNFGGWIELYNPGTTSVSLSGMTLSDHNGHSHKLSSKHGSVPAGGFRCLWFGHYGSDTAPNGSAASMGKARYEKQIPFKLDCDGGTLTLVKNNSEIASLSYPTAIGRCSWARTTDGGEDWNYCCWPTAEATNAGARFASQRTAAPVPSHDGGIVDGNQSFTVAVPEGARLYYTTDGTVPTEKSASLSPNANGTVTLTATEGSIFRMRCMAEGYLPSQVITRSFLPAKGTISTQEDWRWDEDKWDWVYVPSSHYDFRIGGFAIISVTTNPQYLYGDDLGIYTRGNYGGWSYWGYGNYYEDWDRPVNVEIFSPEGLPLMNQEMDMCISGGMSRSSEVKSFKVKSNRIYEGMKYMHTAGLFPSKPYQRYKDIMVRAGGATLFLRHLDNALQHLAQKSGLYIDAQTYRPAFVFFNGKFQEILLMREPTNKQYGYANYGMDTDYMDTLEESDITGVSVASGDRKAFDELLTVSATCASSENSWQRVRELLDIDEYANYFALETYLDNKDWPQNNIKLFREKTSSEDASAEGTGRFHVVLQDLDWTFGDTERNTFSRIDEGASYAYAVAGYQENPMVTIFLNLMKRAEFRKRFVDSFCLMAGSVYSPSFVATTIDNLYAEMQQGYPAEMHSDLQNVFQSYKDYLGASWQNSRYNYLRRWQRASSSTMQPITATITSSDKGARILLNDMPVPTNTFNGTLFLPITLKAESHAGRTFVAWKRNGSTVSTASTYSVTKDGNYEAVFADAEATPATIVINEVGAANGIYQSERLKRSDWIELYNCAEVPLSLDGMTLSDGATKSARLSGIIPAHGYRLLWADGEELPFKLANAEGTVLVLSDATGKEINRFFYHQHTAQQSVGRWPDGGTNIYRFERPTACGANLLTSYASLLKYTPSPVGIPTPEVTSPSHTPTYDLQGRPVAPSRHTLQVLHGKKKIEY